MNFPVAVCLGGRVVGIAYARTVMVPVRKDVYYADGQMASGVTDKPVVVVDWRSR